MGKLQFPQSRSGTEGLETGSRRIWMTFVPKNRSQGDCRAKMGQFCWQRSCRYHKQREEWLVGWVKKISLHSLLEGEFWEPSKSHMGKDEWVTADSSIPLEKISWGADYLSVPLKGKSELASGEELLFESQNLRTVWGGRDPGAGSRSPALKWVAQAGMDTLASLALCSGTWVI